MTTELKDTYFHISLLSSDRKWFTLSRMKCTKCTIFPLGLVLSPRNFTKCMDVALASLKLQGIRVLVCIDAWLILAQSQEMALWHRDIVVQSIKRGLRLRAEKSVFTPLQKMTFMGVVWDSVMMWVPLSLACIEMILAAVTGIMLWKFITIKQFQTVVSSMI